MSGFMDNEIIAYISSPGDRSVGLFGYNTEVPTGITEFEDKEHRNYVRRCLSECFSEIWDDPATVMFSDECQDDPAEIRKYNDEMEWFNHD